MILTQILKKLFIRINLYLILMPILLKIVECNLFYSYGIE